MADFLKYIRKFLGLSLPDGINYNQNRKRRSAHDEFENFAAKIRCITRTKMDREDIDGWKDYSSPSTSRTSFLRHPSGRRNIGSLSAAPFHNDIIDVSDDDDFIATSSPNRTSSVLDVLSDNPRVNRAPFDATAAATPNTVFRNAKKSINKCSKFFDGRPNGHLNESIRLGEQRRYRELLVNAPSTAAVYGDDSLSNTSARSARRTFEYPELGSRSRKILSMLTERKAGRLTDEKSTRSSVEHVSIKDSDSDVEIVSVKKKIEPVNSLQKMLDTEPFMDPKYITKLEEDRKHKKKETEKLIQEERKKRDRFNNLNRENINLLLEEQIKNCKISEVIILDEYPGEEELNFPEFTPDQEEKINDALKAPNPNQVFAEKYNLRITAQDLMLFNEKQWLNDEVINFYVNMIQQRSEQKNMPRVHSFSTFFYPKLVSSGYSSLRRWTKRVDIFAYDIIIVPVHLGFHWCMATIDFRDQSIRYYDSMLGKNNQCLMALENYLREEHKDKKKTEFDTSGWKKILMKDIPRQMNGSDCGVFSCTFAEFITRNAKIIFTQENMPYIRRKMVIEIIEGRLLT